MKLLQGYKPPYIPICLSLYQHLYDIFEEMDITIEMRGTKNNNGKKKGVAL